MVDNILFDKIVYRTLKVINIFMNSKNFIMTKVVKLSFSSASIKK